MGGFGNPLVIGASCCFPLTALWALWEPQSMKHVLIFLAFSSVISQANADWSSIPSTDFEMADFPKDGSKAWNKDFEILFREQKARTKAQCALSAKQPRPTFEMFYGHTELIDPDQFEATKELGNRVAKFSERVANYFKDKFERPRPYNEVKGLRPCVPAVTGQKAYPSSHAAVAIATSCMLVDVFPDKKDDLEAYAVEIGNLRYIVGLHHPSDVEAGQKLGSDICDRLRSESDYSREIRAIKKAL